MYQHRTDQQQDSSSELAEIVIKTLEMCSEKNPKKADHQKTELIVSSQVTAPRPLKICSATFCSDPPLKYLSYPLPL